MLQVLPVNGVNILAGVSGLGMFAEKRIGRELPQPTFLTYARSIREQVCGNPVCRLTLVSGRGHRNLLKHLNYRPLREMLNQGEGGGAALRKLGLGADGAFPAGRRVYKDNSGGGVG